MRNVLRGTFLSITGLGMIAGYQIVLAETVKTPTIDAEVVFVEFVPSTAGAGDESSHLEVIDLIDKLPIVDNEPAATPSEAKVEIQAVSTENRCPEWMSTAIDAGWDEQHWDRLSYIIWRESRCLSGAFNGSDPNSGSRGLSQINGFWCRPSRYHPNGWLQEQGVLSHCDDLYDPMVNLVAAKAIFDYGADRGNCPWGPWTTKKTSWC